MLYGVLGLRTAFCSPVHTSVDHDIDLEYCVKNDVAVPFRAPLVVAWLG
nr:hypothetical protein [Candidatus Sigynarchaeota archaeon]